MSAMAGDLTLETGGDMHLTVHDALVTDSMRVEVRTYSWPEPMHDRALRPHRWFIDMSLTPRPDAPRGRFLERWRRAGTEPIGDILVAPPGLELHASHGAGRQRSLSLLLHPQLLDLDVERLDETALVEALHIHDEAARATLWRLAAELCRRGVGAPALAEAAVLAIAARMEATLSPRSAAAVQKRGGLSPWRLRLIEDRLRADLPPPRIGELARLCGLSERQLTRGFRQETGESLGRRIASFTLQRACGLLLDTDLPVEAIARSLGFCSGAAFAAALRNSTGWRPTELRLRGKASPLRSLVRDD